LPEKEGGGACKNANIKTIPSIVRDIENRNASEIALIENIQRVRFKSH